MDKIIEIDCTDFTKNVEKLINDLFDKSKNRDAAEFIPACLYYTGALTIGDEFDMFKSLYEFQKTIFELLLSTNFDENFRIRIMMMYYCHVIESDSFYNFLYNISAIADGDPNIVEPFKKTVFSDKELLEKINEICSSNTNKIKIKKFNKLTKKFIPISVSDKIQIIKKKLIKIGLTELSELIDSLYNKNIRNAFSHNEYNVYNGNIQFLSNKEVKSMSFMDFMDIFTKMANFIAVLSEKSENVVSSMTDGKLYKFNGQYGEFSIIFNKDINSGLGSFLITSKKTTSSI